MNELTPTGTFAGVLNFMSYEFEWRARYKKFFRDFKIRPKFQCEVLAQGHQLAEANGHLAWYQSVGPDMTCFLVNEYLHERFAFAHVEQAPLALLPFSSQGLQVLAEGKKLQQLLPFYKIDRYREHLDRYLLLEDDSAALFLTDGMLRLFAAHGPDELPEWQAFFAAMRRKQFDPSVLVVAKQTGHLYSPFISEPIHTQDLPTTPAQDNEPSILTELLLTNWQLKQPTRPQ